MILLKIYFVLKVSLDSIYGSDIEPIVLNNDHDVNNHTNNNNNNNSDSIENDNNNTEPCPSIYVNTLSNLLSVHHISGAPKILPDKLDSTIIMSAASSSGDTANSSQSKDAKINISNEQTFDDNASPLETSNAQVEEQLMDEDP